MARGEWGNPNTQTNPIACRIQWRMGVAVCQTGFKLRNSNPVATADVDEAADLVRDFAQTNFRTILTIVDQLIGVDVVNMVTGEGASRSFSNVTGTLNFGEADSLPSFVTAPVSLKGELRKRYGQGRMLWPFRSEFQNAGNAMSPQGIAALQGVIDAMAALFLGTAGSTDYTLINTHGIIPPRAATAGRPAQPEVPASWYDVTTIRLNTQLSFLRSRKQGVGS